MCKSIPFVAHLWRGPDFQASDLQSALLVRRLLTLQKGNKTKEEVFKYLLSGDIIKDHLKSQYCNPVSSYWNNPVFIYFHTFCAALCYWPDEEGCLPGGWVGPDGETVVNVLGGCWVGWAPGAKKNNQIELLRYCFRIFSISFQFAWLLPQGDSLAYQSDNARDVLG